MTIDYEAEYNNGRRVANSAALMEAYAALSAHARSEFGGARDVAYGEHPRQRYDLFEPQGYGTHTPLAVFIHGGYWQWRDRHDFSFVVRGCLAHGVAVAMPSYRQAPEVRVNDIIADMRTFVVKLFADTGKRAVITGHSAGGHLAAALVGTDWAGLPGGPFARYAYALSGVFDLSPLVGTTIGEGLHETVESARDVSPLHWPAPPKNRWLTAAVGGDESPEFIRQSVDMAAAWSAAGIAAEAVIVPRTNHFTVLEDLARPDSATVQRIVDLARRAAG